MNKKERPGKVALTAGRETIRRTSIASSRIVARSGAPVKERSTANLYPKEIEQRFLGNLLTDPNLLDKVREITPDMCGIESHRIILEAIYALDAQGLLPTLEALEYRLRAQGDLDKVGGISYLSGLMDGGVGGLFAIRTHAELIAKHFAKREVLDFSTRAAEVALDSVDRSPAQMISDLKSRLDAIKVPSFIRSSGAGNWQQIDAILGPIEWDWQDWLPRGQLIILASDPGLGKSAAALRIADCYLQRAPLPDGTPFAGTVGKVLWCEAEAAQAINLQRARAWGLPLDKLLTPFDDPLVDVRLDLPEHQKAVEKLMRQDDVVFAIVDSLSGGHQLNGNDESDMKPIVQGLAELARDTGKSILLTHHLRKRGLQDAGEEITLDRLRGSTTIAQPARVVWALDVPNPAQKDRKRLSVIKSNLGKFPKAIGFEISEQGLTFTAAPELPRQETLVDRAADVILSLLKDGPVPAKKVLEEIREAGLSEQAANRAKEKLGIVSAKPAGVWHWSLPYRGDT